MDKHDHGHDDPHGHDSHDEGGHDAGGHGGVGKYIAVFVALCILTIISYVVGNTPALREKTPGIMWAMMMAVSCAKASLVILFFMHLKWEANWKYVLTVPASIMSFFLMLMLIPDIGLRTRWYAEERWLYAPVPGEKHESHDAAHEAALEADKHTTGDEGNIFEKKTGHSKAHP